MFQIKVVHLFKIHKKLFLCLCRQTDPLAENRIRTLTQMYICTYCFCENFLLRFLAKGLVFRQKHKNTFSCILKR